MLTPATLCTVSEVEYVVLEYIAIPCSTRLMIKLKEVECVYDDRKLRPGIRTGAIESLNQRPSKKFLERELD